MHKALNSGLAAVMPLVCACGDQPGERAVSGGAIGAGAGAIAGVAVGGSVAGAALLGGAAGAATGALTDKHQMDLDR